MKFMLFIHPDAGITRSPEERATFPERMSAWVEEMDARGIRLDGDVLISPEEARTVRVRNGVPEFGEGAVEASTMPITGFDILECADIDEALEVVARHPVAAFGTLEVRAFAE